MRRRTRCEHLSPIYRKIINHKHNGQVLENGDVRIGKDLALSIKTNLIYKL